MKGHHDEHAFGRCRVCNPNDEQDAGLGCLLVGFLIVLGCMGFALFEAARIPQGVTP